MSVYEQKWVERVEHDLALLKRQIRELRKKMSDITSIEQQAEDRETALEGRVTAHEKNLSDLRDQLQAEIDAMKAGQVSTATAATRLQALANKMDAFDPDAAPATPPASSGDNSGSSTPANPPATPPTTGGTPVDTSGGAGTPTDASGSGSSTGSTDASGNAGGAAPAP